MELILTNHSSYPRIGDGTDHQLLRRTIAQWEKGEKTDADLRAAEDRMTELALGDQIVAGLEIVTDGQIRWYDTISHLAGKLQGIRINGLLRFFDTNTYFRQPVVHGAIERTKPLLVGDFEFAKGKSSQPVKPVLTGPVTLARHSIEENGKAGSFERLVESYTAALTPEVAALAAAGAGLIQIDEPSLLKYSADLPQAARSLKAFGAAKGSSQPMLAVYFGDATGSAKPLALGLVDGRNTRLEDTRTVAGQLEKIGRCLGSARAWLSPSCGFEYLPRDRAQLKLRHLRTIRREFLGSAE
ncbi:MAG: hypothetical protein LAO07_06135 [Acidobacteriia bacterium]|nr:hypothetical protein [Terriglobia bacterium]